MRKMKLESTWAAEKISHAMLSIRVGVYDSRVCREENDLKGLASFRRYNLLPLFEISLSAISPLHRCAQRHKWQFSS